MISFEWVILRIIVWKEWYEYLGFDHIVLRLGKEWNVLDGFLVGQVLNFETL